MTTKAKAFREDFGVFGETWEYFQLDDQKENMEEEEEFEPYLHPELIGKTITKVYEWPAFEYDLNFSHVFLELEGKKIIEYPLIYGSAIEFEEPINAYWQVYPKTIYF